MKQADIQAMSNDELRFKIAELLGWRRSLRNCGPEHEKVECWLSPALGLWMVEGDCFWGMSNYPADLNACHEMEEALLGDTQREAYADTLVNVCQNRRIHRATARQRCEAFVATVTQETT